MSILNFILSPALCFSLKPDSSGYTSEYLCPSCCCLITKLYLTLCYPHKLQDARLPSPSLSPGVCSNLCPLSRWCYPTISTCHPLLHLSSIFFNIRFFSNESALCISGQSIGASASVLPMNIQGWFSLQLTGLISLLSGGLSRISSITTIWKH